MPRETLFKCPQTSFKPFLIIQQKSATNDSFSQCKSQIKISLKESCVDLKIGKNDSTINIYFAVC